MKFTNYIFLVLSLIFSVSCSNTRFLADDQLLYTGREIKIINPTGTKSSEVKSEVNSVTSHKINNAIFGKRVLPPVGLWVYNYWSKDPSKKIRYWLYKTLSSPPVLLSEVNSELRAKKIENNLFDLGYFHTKAWSSVDTSRRNTKKARISYFVRISPAQHYNEITMDTLRDHLDSLIAAENFQKQIKPGQQFNLTKLKASRDELSKRLQDSGYFYFVPEFIDLKADTTKKPNLIDLTIGKKKKLPEAVTSIYTLNKIIFRNTRSSDTVNARADTSWYDGVAVISPKNVLNDDVFLKTLLFHPSERYSFTAYQKTLSRLNNLGIFRSVNISFAAAGGDSLSTSLDVLIKTVMADNIRLDFEADLTSKSSGYVGPLFSVGLSNSNAFNGAEKLKFGFTGGFDWQWGARKENQLGANSYEFGLSTGLTLPGIYIPFRKERENSLILQRTSLNGDFSILNRTAYYKMFSVKTNLDYEWSSHRYIKHSFYPLYLNSVKLLATTAGFDSVVNKNIYIRKSFEEQFILGPRYEFTFNNTADKRPDNFLFQAGISTSGNLIDLLESAGKKNRERPYTFLANIYSQYVKFTTDFRYYHNWSDNSLVFRLYSGIGIPLSNSTSLPYVEQFFSGGAYSIRGFTARYVGPGSFHAASHTGFIDQSGDIKLESNLEYRFSMSKLLKGALFIDTGNIWLVNEDAGRPGARFNRNDFYRQLAVGSGFGVRFDFGFFVLRTDVGFPVRTPYVSENNKNWLFGTHKMLSGGSFYLAIGYPF